MSVLPSVSEVPHEETADVPRHVAIIMDGNGRWAEQRGLPRTAGHKQGVEAVRNIVRAAGNAGIEYLTLFAFSSENWNRPESEIGELFSLLRFFIRRDLADLHENDVCIRIIGERDGIPSDLLAMLDDACNLTEHNTGRNLVIAFNYGSRSEIVRAARGLAGKVKAGTLDPDRIDEGVFEAELHTHGIPDPDLLIRTSGELRLSNFLLWQLAYCEFVFVETLWPDFSQDEFLDALRSYQSRNRRFGGLQTAQTAI